MIEFTAFFSQPSRKITEPSAKKADKPAWFPYAAVEAHGFFPGVLRHPEIESHAPVQSQQLYLFQLICQISSEPDSLLVFIVYFILLPGGLQMKKGLFSLFFKLLQPFAPVQGKKPADLRLPGSGVFEIENLSALTFSA